MKIIVDEPHNPMVVWRRQTTKKWRDEGNPNPEHKHNSVRGERHLPNNKTKYIFLYLSPYTPPTMKFI